MLVPSESMPWRAKVKCLLPAFVFIITPLRALPVEPDWVFTVQASASVQVAPPQITLAWEPDQFGAVSYTVYRKGKADNAWGNPLAALSGVTSTYTDTTVSVGTTYEYQIVKVGVQGYT